MNQTFKIAAVAVLAIFVILAIAHVQVPSGAIISPPSIGNTSGTSGGVPTPPSIGGGGVQQGGGGIAGGGAQAQQQDFGDIAANLQAGCDAAALKFNFLKAPGLITITPQNPKYGTDVKLQADKNVFAPPLVAPLKYVWLSSVDGVITTFTGINPFITQDLNVGIHKIAVLANDSKGTVIGPGCYAKDLVVNAQPLGEPVQVVPRFVTTGNLVRAYNVTPGYPNIYCKVSYSDQDVPCGLLLKSQPVDICKKGKLNSPVLEFDLHEAKAHIFTIAKTQATGIPVTPAVGVGEMDIGLVSPAGNGDPSDFGALVDEDFQPSGLQLQVSTGENIDQSARAPLVKGVFFSLYRVKDCGLKQVVPLTQMSYFGRQKNFFVGYIDQPQDCQVGESCSYVGEIIGLNGRSKGGFLFSFTYGREIATLSSDPATYDFGELTAGTTTDEATISIANSGAAVVDSLTATPTSTRITATLSTNTLEVGETADLVVQVNVEEAAAAGAARDYVNISGVSNGEALSVAVPIIYTVAAGEIIIPPPPPEQVTIGAKVTPQKWDIGKLAAGKDTAKEFTVGATKGTDGVSVEIEIPEEDLDSFVSDVASLDLGAGETKATVTFTAAKPPGKYASTITFKFAKEDAEPESVEVPVTYEVTEDVQALYNSANSRYESLDDKLIGFSGPLAQNPARAAELKPDKETAESSLKAAKADLSKAQTAIKAKNDESAKASIAEANDKLDEAKRAIDKIDSVLNAIPKPKERKNLTPIIILLAIVAVIAGGIFAVREGIIPIYKYPQIQAIFEKIGLSSLIEPPLEAKPRFTPEFGGMQQQRPQSQYPPQEPAEKPDELGGTQPAGTVKPQMPPMTPEQKAKMAEYIKQHPEYAAYLKQKYTSYDNRRYE